jgi:hypothetical protein
MKFEWEVVNSEHLSALYASEAHELWVGDQGFLIVRLKEGVKIIEGVDDEWLVVARRKDWEPNMAFFHPAATLDDAKRFAEKSALKQVN